MNRELRLLSLGLRVGRLCGEESARVFKKYLELAGGPSWSDESHALTDAEIDELEAATAEAELRSGISR